MKKYKFSLFLFFLLIIALSQVRLDNIKKKCIQNEFDFLLKTVKINIDLDNGYRKAKDQLFKVAEEKCKKIF
jgi:hypothetical protein